MKTTKPFSWKIFFILLAACVGGILAVLPYTLDLQKSVLTQLPMPLWALLTLQVLQNALLFALAIGLGLLIANRIGLGLPLLEAKLAGETIWPKLKAFLPISLLIGILGSVLIVGLDVYIFGPALKAELGAQANALNLQGAQPAAWKGLLASFYGGINEEVLLRLFLMSLLAWLGKFINRTAEGRPTMAVFWIANLLAAVLFGLGHLPATATLVPLTPLVIVRAVVLNGLLGIGLGYLYFTRGLESAIISHFSADLVLHVLLAL
jgi:membrane protease YdiL (CAAX protease family)